LRRIVKLSFKIFRNLGGGADPDRVAPAFRLPHATFVLPHATFPLPHQSFLLSHHPFALSQHVLQAPHASRVP
jgi:hypothetical protein